MATDFSWHLPIGLSHEQRQTITKNLKTLKNAEEKLPAQHFLKKAFPIKRANLIDAVFQNQNVVEEKPDLMDLEGPNQAKLNYAVFVPNQPESCSSEKHNHRTLLKAKRTLLNLQELQKAFPENNFDDLYKQINDLCLIYLKPREFNILARRVSQSEAFQHYLEQKEQFFKLWGEQNSLETWHSSKIKLFHQDIEVAFDSIKKQSQQNETPQILRYNDLHKFRRFHTTKHKDLDITHLDFWENESNQKELLRLLNAIRKHFGESTPFHLFRFGNGFTYLICGFDDESLTDSLMAGLDKSLASLKPLLRLNNGGYCILEADQVDRRFYFQCLKETLRPFIFYFNRTLNLNLELSFIKLFQT